ncbi:hypothetical protein N8508_00030 [bacterium]|nr:hypothetical protein [bacterium]
MSNVKIVTTKPSRFGQKMNFPIDGEKNISNDGIVEVSQDAADLLVGKGAGWEYANKSAKTKKEAKVVEKVVEVVEEVAEEVTEEIVEESNDANGGDTQAVDLNEYTAKELKAMCSDAGLPKSAWKNLNKGKLVTYLSDKMQ